jgi:hypothetical protein
VELVGGTDLGRGRARRIEHGRDRRRESGSERAPSASGSLCSARVRPGGGAGENRVHPASRASGRGGVDECRIRFLLIT